MGDGFGLVWLDGRNMAAPKKGDAGKGGEGHDGHGTGAMSVRFGQFDKSFKQIAEAPVDTKVCECCPTAAAVTADGEGDRGVVPVALGPDHFADVDAGDPDRRVERDVGRVGEGRIHFVAVAGEGNVFGEGQVGPDREDEDEDDRDRDVARPPLEPSRTGRRCPPVALREPAHSSSTCPRVSVPHSSGELPMIVSPLAYFSLPASQTLP